MGTAFRVIFLDANDHTLQQRYSESRRRHPLTDRLQKGGKSPSLQECIDTERELLAPLREQRSEEHTSELQSLMSTSYAVFCLKKKTPRYADTQFIKK